MQQAPPKNVLIVMVDQMRVPRTAYGDDHGLDAALKSLLSFEGAPSENPWAEVFPGFARLSEDAVVLSEHSVAATACIPSRATIMTSQYGTRTGVTQTDGLFKSGDAVAFPWLEAGTIPTIGHWFRAAGFSTHYFGKCHFADPPGHTLEGLGFSDWELSWPEPHGSNPGNLGFYRDYQFSDLACTFLRRMAMAIPSRRDQAAAAVTDPTGETPSDDVGPWCAVVSFTNPHDIAAYPALPRQVDPDAPPVGPLSIPAAGSRAVPAPGGSWSFPLNPAGVGADIANAPPPEAMARPDNAPDCQWDYAVKMGLGLAIKTGMAVARAAQAARAAAGQPPLTDEEVFAIARDATLASNLPFATSADPDTSVARFIQYYAYLQSVVDQHIARVLQTLDETGLADDTLVVFLADHGEYGGIRGHNMEKWHGAWQEILHVPVVFQHKSLNRGAVPRHIDAVTSHVDLLPTLLGLMVSPEDVEAARAQLRLTHTVPPFAGLDLSGVVSGAAPSVDRDGVLFVTDDEITEPLPLDGDPHQDNNNEEYAFFLKMVDLLVEGDASIGLAPVAGLRRGPVVQPNHVRTVRSGDWKLSRYSDPSGAVAPQWELFDLSADPMELRNLLDAHGTFPALASGVPAEVADKATSLGALLVSLEDELLSPWPG